MLRWNWLYLGIAASIILGLLGLRLGWGEPFFSINPHRESAAFVDAIEHNDLRFVWTRLAPDVQLRLNRSAFLATGNTVHKLNTFFREANLVIKPMDSDIVIQRCVDSDARPVALKITMRKFWWGWRVLDLGAGSWTACITSLGASQKHETNV